MKKIIISIFILFLFSFSCFAEDLTAEGFGTTAELARDNAKENLSRYINGEFVSTKVETNSSNVTKTETGKTGISVSQKSYLSENSFVSMGYLRSVEYIDEKQNGDSFSVTAIIRDNQVNRDLLQSEMSSLKTTVIELNDSLEGKTSKVKKGILVNLLGSISEFDDYKKALIYMGHSDLIPDLGINITATSVFSEYQNIVLAEGYKLEELEQTVTDEAEKKKLQEELYQNRQEQRRVEREKAQEIKAREEASKNLLIQKINQAQNLVASQTVTTENNNDFEKLLAEALHLKDVFMQACSQCNDIITEEFAEIDKDLYAEAAAVENRPYRLAELNTDGTPLEQVYSVREDEIDYLYMSSLMHKAEVYKTIRESLFEGLKNKYSNYDAVIQKLNNSFKVKIEDSSFSVKYDPVNFKWIVTVNLCNQLYLKNALSFELSYEKLTGKKIQEAKFRGQPGYEDYMTFLDEVDYIDALMRSFGEYFKVNLSFDCDCYKQIDLSHVLQYRLEEFSISSDTLNDVTCVIGKAQQCDDVLKIEMPLYLKTFSKD